MKQDTPGEPPSTPTLLKGSSITREQPLVQLEITSFLNPAPREQDWPTQQNLVASDSGDHPATKISSRGSPSKGARIGLEKQERKADGFGDEQDCAVRISGVAQGLENDGMISSMGEGSSLLGGMDQECEESILKVAPSRGSSAMEKSLDGDTVAVLSRCTIPKVDTNSELQECVFKRGGRCVNHDMIGEKIVETSKVWDKKKNGMFGWKTRTKTKYVCHYKGVATSDVNVKSMDDCQDGRVAKSNSMSGGDGLEKTKWKNTALTRPTTEVLGEVGNVTRISRLQLLKAGSFSSEMTRISGVVEEKD